MKEIKLVQSYIGNFNWGNPSEKSFSFSLGLYEDNKLIEENGIKAVLQYSGDLEDESDFEEPIDNIETVFDLCFKYSNKVWSTTNYKAQCLLFGKLYIQYFYELDTNLLEKRKIKLQRDLEEIQRKLLQTGILNDLTYQFNHTLNNQIKDYQKSIDYYTKENSQLKEDSEKFFKNQDQILSYQNKINELNSLIVKEYLNQEL